MVQTRHTTLSKHAPHRPSASRCQRRASWSPSLRGTPLGRRRMTWAAAAGGLEFRPWTCVNGGSLPWTHRPWGEMPIYEPAVALLGVVPLIAKRLRFEEPRFEYTTASRR